jgi:hypothetical protein
VELAYSRVDADGSLREARISAVEGTLAYVSAARNRRPISIPPFALRSKLL